MTRATASSPLSTAAVWLLGAMVSLPFLNPHHPLPLPSFLEESLAMALGVAAAGVLLVAYWREPPAALAHSAIAMLALAACAFAQQLGGLAAHSALAALFMVYLLWGALVLSTAGALAHRIGAHRVVSAAAIGLIVAADANAFAALVQLIAAEPLAGGLVSMFGGGRPYGNLGQANHFSQLGALGIASVAYLYVRGSLGRASAALLMAPLLLALGVAASRTLWLYFALLLVFAMLHARANGRALLRFVAVAIGAAVLLQIATPAFMPAIESLRDTVAAAHGRPRGQLDTSLARAMAFGGTADPSLTLRLDLWGVAVASAVEAPLAGHGIGSFALRYFDAAGAGRVAGTGAAERNPHDIVLQIAAEMGIPAALMLVAAVALWFYRNLRLRQELWTAEHYWALAVAGVGVVHALLEYPWYYAQFLGVACVAFGVGERGWLVARRRVLARVVWTGAVLTGLMVLALTLGDYLSLRRWAYGIDEAALRDPQIRARQSAELAKLQRSSLLAPWVELPLSSTLAPDGTRSADKIAFNERVMRYAPIDLVVEKQILLLAAAQRHTEARALLEVFRRAFPGQWSEFTDVVAALAAEAPERFGALAASMRAVH
jgi:O-antigen ligase